MPGPVGRSGSPSPGVSRKRQNTGIVIVIIAATAMEASPSDTTEKVGETNVAIAPDSKSPSLGPPATTAVWMAFMRPRS